MSNENSLDNYFISADKNKIDKKYVHRFLTNSYWSPGITFEKVSKGIEASFCFGVYDAAGQVGFARLITDKTSFAYICDLFIDEKCRGRGLGKRLVQSILANPELQEIKRILLATKDAHGLYQKAGFTALPNPERYMVYNPAS